MKQDLVEYISEITHLKDEVFDEIVMNKYKKFQNFFELTRSYSDDIVKMNYNDCEKNTLDITITMSKNANDNLKEEILNKLRELGYEITTSVSKRKLNIVMVYNEKTIF